MCSKSGWLSLINQAENARVPASLSDAEYQASVSHFLPLRACRSVCAPRRHCQPPSQLQSRLFPSCRVVFWLQLDSESLIDHLGGVRSPLRPPVNLGSCSALLKLFKYQIWVLHFVLPNVYWILSGFAFKVLSFNYARLKIELRIRMGCLGRKRMKERET